jgi:NADPH-dependent glutamate synthase beta subunit-like oxidoreductase
MTKLRPKPILSTFKVGLAFETTLPGVFAAGDAVQGPATVIDAIAQGNKVALLWTRLITQSGTGLV